MTHNLAGKFGANQTFPLQVLLSVLGRDRKASTVETVGALSSTVLCPRLNVGTGASSLSRSVFTWNSERVKGL